jgi:methionyl-tRNA formyltransferase
MGTPDFAVASLKMLIEKGYEVVGVLTAPDRPAGRGQKLQSSAVKTYALTQKLPILQPTNLKDDDFLTSLKNLGANLQIVVAFRMLPKVVWSMPKYGTFNLHASLLPEYRGAAPINWAIINGERKTGVTTFFIDDQIDTGEIILQKEIPINENDSAGDLHDRLMHLGAELIIDTVELIRKNAVSTKKQNMDSMLRSAHKIFKEDCEINWDRSVEEIHDHVRGLSPYPVAWTHLINDGQSTLLKIYKTAKEPASHKLRAGQILADKQQIKVAVKGGYLQLLEIQFPGKRRMSVKEVLNGLKLEKRAYLE